MGDRIPGSSFSNPITYRGWNIYADDCAGTHPPGYAFVHDDYDPTPMYADDGPSDNRHGWARNVEEAKAEIDEQIEEATEADRAAVLKPFKAVAVVGDGDPEPVAVTGKAGERKAFTIGCADPYMIDAPDCPCHLLPEVEQDDDGDRYIAKIKDMPPEPMEVPDNTLSPKFRQKLERSFAAWLAPRHGYAGFGRRGK